LAPAVDILLTRPKGVEPALHALLVASAHQIEYSRNAPEATVHAAVDAARILKQERGTGLVNAVMRRFVRERGDLFRQVDQTLPGRTAHPTWLVERLGEAWSRQVLVDLLDANNAHPPMVLRLDTSRCQRDEYLRQLQTAGIGGAPFSWAPTAIRLEEPVPLSDLPGFEAGLVSVQDAGAQLAAPLLDAQPGMRVLDACAAPGGKTGHLLEYTSGLTELVAVDIDARRVERIADNMRRSGRTATLVAADVRKPDSFWDRRPFDRILLDAPCSSTGVIRRHPDIKLLRRSGDIAALAATQLEILGACFAMLAPGGRLLYCTCSVLPEENQAVAERFLRSESTARQVPLSAELVPGALSSGIGVQLVPGSEAGSDGFYYACLEKTTVGT
jgi:16S rRNA (cytosine967-C5)-methyltransferase